MQPRSYSPPPAPTVSGVRLSQDRYYRHSGKVPAGGLALLILVGAAAAVGGAALYILARVYIPYDILNVLFNIAFGLLIGLLAGQAALWGKVRNSTVTATIGLLAGALGLYAAWVFWLYHKSEGQLYFSPVDIFAKMKLIAAMGDWSVRDITPKGVWLYLIWLVEAIIILACSGALAHARMHDIPFCERTGAWLKNIVRVGPFAPPADLEGFRRQLENGDTAILKTLQPITITHPEHYAEIQLRASTMLHLLSVKTVTVSVQNGQTIKKETPIVNHLIVDAAAHDMARRLQPMAGPMSTQVIPPKG